MNLDIGEETKHIINKLNELTNDKTNNIDIGNLSHNVAKVEVEGSNLAEHAK